MDVRYLSAFQDDGARDKIENARMTLLLAAGFSFLLGFISLFWAIIGSEKLKVLFYIGYGLFGIAALFVILSFFGRCFAGVESYREINMVTP